MEPKIYTVSPQTRESHSEYVTPRAEAYARFLGENILDREYAGIYNWSNKTSGNCFWLADQVLTPSEIKTLGVELPDDFYGSSLDILSSSKAITHPLVPDPKNKPIDFPDYFPNLIDDLTLEGYVGFSLEDLYRAYLLLEDKGYSIILKYPFRPGENTFVPNLLELKTILRDYKKEKLNRYGLVLEAYIDQKDLTAYSAGQFRLGKDIFSYVGTQEKRLKTVTGEEDYTQMYLAKGSLRSLNKKVPKKFHGVLSQVPYLERAFNLLPSFFTSRFNLNFIEGKVQKDLSKPLTKKDTGIKYTEFTGRPGQATSGEFLGAKTLLTNSSLDLVVVRAITHHGILPPNYLQDGDTVFFEGSTAQYGLMTSIARVEEISEG